MNARRVQVIIICEDSQHGAFIRRFLKNMGWDKRTLRIQVSPSAGGSAEQWVRNRFPVELSAYRMRKKLAAYALIAMIDADMKDAQDRIDEFKKECHSQQISFRTNDEAVAIAVPKRNIETWLHYLNGHHVDEIKSYPKLDRERDCKPAVDHLVKICKSTGLGLDAPPALGMACEEYNFRIKPARQE